MSTDPTPGNAAHPYEALRPLGKRVIREAENLCEVTPNHAQPRRNDGGCPCDPVAIRVEHGFVDLVCYVHATAAEHRGAIVVWGTDD